MENTKSNKGYASEVNVVAEMNTISILRAVRMAVPNCEFDIIIINTQVLANAIAKNPDALKEVGIGLWEKYFGMAALDFSRSYSWICILECVLWWVY